MPFSISVDRGAHLAKLSGEMTSSEWRELTDQFDGILTGSGAAAAIELSEVSMLDSAGLGCLIQIVSRARMRGDTVVLVAPSAFVRGVLEVTRLDSWFDISPTIDALVSRTRSSA